MTFKNYITQIVVPSSGILWGMLGYAAQVSLIYMQPYLMPAIASHAAITMGFPLCKCHWYRKIGLVER